MVVDTDGSNLRTLTDLKDIDWNPSWMRDGSNRVIFTRHTLEYGVIGAWLTNPVDSAVPGTERSLSDYESMNDPVHGYSMEWAYTSFHDGKIWINREHFDNRLTRAFLMTLNDNPAEPNIYEEFTIDPDTTYGGWNTSVHKLFLSADETKISYMRRVW
eukprot:UN24211